MDAVAQLVDEASNCEPWLFLGTDRGADAPRACLIQLLDLYPACLALLPERSDKLNDGSEIERIGDAE